MKILNQATQLEPLDLLQPHPRNPRKGDVDAIHRSIEVNGFLRGRGCAEIDRVHPRGATIASWQHGKRGPPRCP